MTTTTNTSDAAGFFTLGDPIADTKAPTGVPVPQMWEQRKADAKLVNPPTAARSR